MIKISQNKIDHKILTNCWEAHLIPQHASILYPENYLLKVIIILC